MTQTPTLSPKNAVQPVYELTEADKKRVERVAQAWKAYNGELDPPLKPMPGEPSDNVLTNQMMTIVHGGINFLFGKELEISVEEGAPQGAQDFLNDVWGRKEQRIPLLQKLAMNGAIAGSAFLRIVPDNAGNYRLVAVDPATVFVQTAPQDCDTVLLYCIEYCSDEKRDGKPVRVYYREEIARIDPDGNASQGMPDEDDTWSIQHWSRIGDRGNWTPAGEPIVWPYPFSPLFSCQNLPRPNDFWGTPDLTPDLIGVNSALNLVQSSVNRILKLFGSPILYSTGTGDQIIDIKPGKIIGLPLTESKIVAVTLASDVANALSFADNLRSDIDAQSGVPGVATGRIKDMPRGNLSGIAIELLFQPLMLKTNQKRCTYGELILDVSQALLVLRGMSGDIDVSLPWISPLPHDDLPAVQAAIAKLELGISKTSLQRELNYEPEEEAKLKQSETEQALNSSAQTQLAPGLPQGVPGAPNLPGQMYPPPPAQQPGQPAPAQSAQQPPVSTQQKGATNGRSSK